MYNIKKAVSRLDFAPKLADIKVTDIKKGLGEFVPKPDKPVSFTALKQTLKKAGYTLADAEISVSGTLIRDGDKSIIEASSSKQRFVLEVGTDNPLAGIEPGNIFEASGGWQTVEKDTASLEVIQLRSAKKLATVQRSTGAEKSQTGAERSQPTGIQVSLNGVGNGSGLYFSSIRTTNPGLTVYRGGAVIPRYFYTRQHLSDLKIDRQGVRVGVSYTPTPTLQLEAEIPYQHTQFESVSGSGSGNGFGNITLWSKYRFYRTLQTWGDKQAAIRIGVELPTGKKEAPGNPTIVMTEFVRQQLTAINGGLAFHSDLSYSQARRRVIYGGNLETVLRGEREGYRTGHEVRLNTDLEYVLLPFKYQNPGHELFASLETSYSYRDTGRLNGRKISGSSGSEFFVAPGLQFTATPRFVVEASFQVPVVRNLGPLLLRTDKSFLIGIRYLY